MGSTCVFFFFNDTAPTEIYTLSLHDALPISDTDGYVRLPNVNGLVEMTDMRDALRSYEANLSVIEASRTIVRQTISLLER